MARPTTAKDMLTGLTLANGWKVGNPLPRSAGETGGNFSAGYIVQSPDGTAYFLKAIDFSKALNSSDPARSLQILTEAFNLERDILQLGKRLSHVVTAVEDGAIAVQHNGQPQTVQYLILELAEDSLRKMAVKSTRLPISLGLKALHNVANGLRQLHGKHVAHQDLKPSNVLQFLGETFKVCDVGRASIRGKMAPHDALNFAGDPTYAPPELIYGQADPDFVIRRWGCDAYLLGSLAAFLVSGLPMTALIVRELHQTSRPTVWGGTYANLLPQVRAAFARAIEHLRHALPIETPYGDELILCIQQLCDPDPSQRGHPLTRAVNAGTGNMYDLERYVSIFDRLSFQAKVFERRKP